MKIIVLRRILIAGFFLLSGCRDGYIPAWQERAILKGECPNLLEYSEDLQDISWFKEEALVQNNTTNDLNNNPTADMIDISKNPKESRVYQQVDQLPEGQYSFSIYLKALPGLNGLFAIGMQFNGDENRWNKDIVSINDSTWTRAVVRLRTKGRGKLTVYPGYALIKGSTIYRAYVWGAQLEMLQDSAQGPSKYCGKNVILGSSKNKLQFIQN